MYHNRVSSIPEPASSRFVKYLTLSFGGGLRSIQHSGFSDAEIFIGKSQFMFVSIFKKSDRSRNLPKQSERRITVVKPCVTELKGM